MVYIKCHITEVYTIAGSDPAGPIGCQLSVRNADAGTVARLVRGRAMPGRLSDRARNNYDDGGSSFRVSYDQ